MENNFVNAIQQLNEYVFKILPLVKELKEEQNSDFLVSKYAHRINNAKDTNELMADYTRFITESAKLNNKTAVSYLSPIVSTKLQHFGEEERIQRELRLKNEIADNMVPALEKVYNGLQFYVDGNIVNGSDILSSESYRNLKPSNKVSYFEYLKTISVKRNTSVDAINKKYTEVYKLPDEKIVKSSVYDIVDDNNNLYYVKNGENIPLLEDEIKSYLVQKSSMLDDAYKKHLMTKDNQVSASNSIKYSYGELINGSDQKENIVMELKLNKTTTEGGISYTLYRMDGDNFKEISGEEKQKMVGKEENKEKINLMVKEALSKVDKPVKKSDQQIITDIYQYINKELDPGIKNDVIKNQIRSKYLESISKTQMDKPIDFIHIFTSMQKELNHESYTKEINKITDNIADIIKNNNTTDDTDNNANIYDNPKGQ